jgi:hypothetical protein
MSAGWVALAAELNGVTEAAVRGWAAANREFAINTIHQGYQSAAAHTVATGRANAQAAFLEAFARSREASSAAAVPAPG